MFAWAGATANTFFQDHHETFFGFFFHLTRLVSFEEIRYISFFCVRSKAGNEGERALLQIKFTTGLPLATAERVSQPWDHNNAIFLLFLRVHKEGEKSSRIPRIRGEPASSLSSLRGTKYSDSCASVHLFFPFVSLSLRERGASLESCQLMLITTSPLNGRAMPPLCPPMRD